MTRLKPFFQIGATAFLMACGTSPTDAETDEPVDDCHPLVPEAYCYLWITDTPCQRAGMDARRIYRTASGQANADGTATITESWYSFLGDPDKPELDVKDTVLWELSSTDLWSVGELGCPGCERLYRGRAVVQDNPSNWSYADREDVVFLFDTLNPNGNFNEDYAMLVSQGKVEEAGPVMYWPDYARGSWQPDDDTPGSLPAAVSWEPSNLIGECQ